MSAKPQTTADLTPSRVVDFQSVQSGATNQDANSDSEEPTKLIGSEREFDLANRQVNVIPEKEKALEPVGRTTVPGLTGLSALSPVSNGASSNEGPRSRFIGPPLRTARNTRLHEMTFLKMRVFLYKLFTQPRGLRQAWLLGSDVVRIGPKVLLKHHGTVRPTEAFTMDFVRRQTHLPVPAVHDVFLDRRGHVYIMMDYIDAPELQAVWRRLSLAQRSAVVQELVTYLVELRALSPPDPNAVQAVDGGSLIDVRLGSEPFGPFAAVDDFHMYLGHTIIHDRLASNHPYAREALERCRHRTYRIIFSHSDLAPRNILYKDGHIAAIIDWEFSGWYPEYWEFTRTFDSSSWIIPEFWELFKAHFEGQYDDELVMEHVLSAEMTR